ncbi:hypothetical protein EVAR_57179_1 [Eumeta japonica]|uniref:Uncharacterized protein n=1 Tax=Eumeta variegata TaxID=151549 RepID=A0A4C1Z3C3_EUMVA|nr:hypothetical protein EVAR_57179_1 [Eumeta japonica]
MANEIKTPQRLGRAGRAYNGGGAPPRPRCLRRKLFQQNKDLRTVSRDKGRCVRWRGARDSSDSVITKSEKLKEKGRCGYTSM